MKKQFLSVLLILITSFTFAQKKAKAKGSRVISTNKTTVATFNRLVLNESFDVKLVKADSSRVDIVTDNNLHEYIKITSTDSTLSLETTAKLLKKQLQITIYYTKALNTIELSENAKLSATHSLKFDNLTLTASDNSKTDLTIESPLFKLNNNDKARTKLNLTANEATLELNNTSKVEALVNATILYVDLLENADANLQGITENLTVTADTNAYYKGESLVATQATLTTLGRAKANVDVSSNLIIHASGTSNIQIYGNPKISIETFADNAVIRKKMLKN